LKLILIRAIHRVILFSFFTISQDQKDILGRWDGDDNDHSFFEVTKNKSGTHSAISLTRKRIVTLARRIY